jgi:hypothetical protein
LRRISRPHPARATLPTVPTALTVLTACGGPPRSQAAPDPIQAVVSPPLPVDSVYRIETTGSPPPDTTHTVVAGLPRVILLGHGPPDNVVFAEVLFDTASFQAPAGSPVSVTIRPRPGTYGLSLEASAPIRRAELTFKYAVYFLAPTGARTRYGSDIGVERALGIGRLDGEVVTFLPSTRPATDNLRATVTSAGTFVVAAPR